MKMCYFNEDFLPIYRTLFQLKKKRLVIFGAGCFTQFLFDITKAMEADELPQVIGVVDDNPEGKADFWGCKPVRPEEFNISGAEGILISTDCMKTARKFIKRCREIFGFSMALFVISEEFPLEPFQKDSVKIKSDAFSGRRRFFNLGGGTGFIEKNWINVECSFDTGNPGDPFILEHDINSRKKIPVPDNEARLIYSSHLIEHLTQEAVVFLFSEAYRILEPGGLIRIVCPDYDIAYNAWAQNDYSVYEPFKLDERYNKKITIHEAFLCLVATPLFYALNLEDLRVKSLIPKELRVKLSLPKITEIKLRELDKSMDKYAIADYLCSLVKQVNNSSGIIHINWFTYDKVINMLKNAGFVNVRRSELLKSASPHMRNPYLFDSTSPWIQLYVEAEK